MIEADSVQSLFMSSTDEPAKQEPDCYTILGLPLPAHSSSATISNDALKASYRRTLLQHHPDKASTQRSQGDEKGHLALIDRFTVDQIVQAYETLSDPVSREAYNQRLDKARRDTVVSQQTDAKKFAASTTETFDLEELNYEDDKQLWVRSCRCGDSYQVTEAQLEKAATDGEIIVGCHGCSLSIRVMFQVVE